MENRRINYILATKPNTFETLHTLYLRLFVIPIGRYRARPNQNGITARRSGRFGAACPADRSDRNRRFAFRHGHRNHRQARSFLYRTNTRYARPHPNLIHRLPGFFEPGTDRAERHADGYGGARNSRLPARSGRRTGRTPADGAARRHADLPRRSDTSAARRREYAVGAADARHGSQRRKDHRDGESRRTHLRRRQAAVRGKFRIGAAIPRSPRRDRYPGIRRAGRRGKNQEQREREKTHGHEPHNPQQTRKEHQRPRRGRLRNRPRRRGRRSARRALPGRRDIPLFLGKTQHGRTRRNQQQQPGVGLQ